MVYQSEIHLRTSGHRDIHDLTPEVARLVAASRIRNGLAQLFNVGSTAALGTLEFEPGLSGDLPAILDQLIPPSREYGHERAWQQIVHLECDVKPRQRTIVVTVMGEGG